MSSAVSNNNLSEQDYLKNQYARNHTYEQSCEGDRDDLDYISDEELNPDNESETFKIRVANNPQTFKQVTSSSQYKENEPPISYTQQQSQQQSCNQSQVSCSQSNPTSFTQAYTQIKNPLLMSEETIKNQEKLKKVSSQSYQQNLFNRLNHEAVLKEEYHKNLKRIVENEQMEQCQQFQSQKYNGQATQQRTLEQFLEDQEKHTRGVEEKKQMIKQYLDMQNQEEFTGCPKINEKRQSTDDYIPVHERLYNINKKRQEEMEYKRELHEQMQTMQSSFQPQINEKSRNMQRNGRVEDILYNDAFQRREKTEQLKTEVSVKQKSTQQKFVSSKTEQMVASKFIKEFEKILDEVVGNDNEPAIDYIKLSEILNRLTFLHSGENENDFENPSIAQERSLIYDIWNILKGEKYGGISRRNLCQFCLALIGCTGLSLFCEQGDAQRTKKCDDVANNLKRDDDDIRKSKQKNQGSQRKESGQFKQNTEFEQKLKLLRQQNGDIHFGQFDLNQNWCINEEDARLIQKYFDILYRNRLSGEQLKKHNYQDDKQYHPQINKKSKQLANQYREKLLEETAALIEAKQINVNVPENGKITHVDLLHYQKQAQICYNEKKVSSIQDEQLKECTFKPNTNPTSLKSSQSQTQRSDHQQSTMSKSGIEKSIKLYNMAKPRTQKQDKNKHDLEYEKNYDECTFQPDLMSKNPIKITKAYVCKDVDKSIERMRMAREQRERNNQMFERGYKAPINLHKSQKKSQQGSVANRSMMSDMTDQNNQYEQQMKDNNRDQYQQPTKQQSYQNQKEEHLNEEEDNDRQNGSQQNQSQSNGRIPLLFVDVNLGLQNTQRIVVYEGDTSENLSYQFSEEHGLDSNMRIKLQELLESQIAGLLTRIEEEKPCNDEEDDDEMQNDKDQY